MVSNYETGRNLELDGWCEELNLGFEYQGPQHESYNEFFHKNIEEFEKQQIRDKLKKNLALKANKPFFEIASRYTFANPLQTRAFLINELLRYGIRINSDNVPTNDDAYAYADTIVATDSL